MDAAIIALIFCLLIWAASNSIDAGTDVAIAMMAPGGIILIGFATGLYGGLHSNAQLLGRGFVAVALCFAIGTLGALFVDVSDDLQFALLVAAPLSGALMIGVRVARWSIVAAGEGARRLLVVAPESVQSYVLKQCQCAPVRFNAAGAVTLDGQGRLLPADIARIQAFVADGGNRTIVISSALLADKRLSETLLKCIDGGGRVETVAEFLADKFGRLPSDDPESLQRLLTSEAKPRALNRAIERAIDIAVVLTLLVLAAPVMALIALGIRLQDGGPVLYRQIRVGLDGRPFTLLKFRSMRVDAEAEGGARWAEKDDDRVTPFGAFLRAHRLDELPQLFNVLRKEMSIVGPRPERPEMVEILRREIPLYEHRHRVLPGLTGWAQINFPYGATIEEAAEKTAFDLYYVENRSPLLNLIILLQTIRVVIFAEGSR